MIWRSFWWRIMEGRSWTPRTRFLAKFMIDAVQLCVSPRLFAPTHGQKVEGEWDIGILQATCELRPWRSTTRGSTNHAKMLIKLDSFTQGGLMPATQLYNFPLILWSGLEYIFAANSWVVAMDSQTDSGNWWGFLQTSWWWQSQDYSVQSSLTRVYRDTSSSPYSNRGQRIGGEAFPQQVC